MKIVIETEIYAELMTFAHAAGSQEFSGVGWVKIEKDIARIYDVRVLAAGNGAFTEIKPERLLAARGLHDVDDMRVWFHRHPMGDGVPGGHNWSGTDDDTIKNSPLGGIPQLMGWSISIVLTPNGWVGRIDNYHTGKTKHLWVEPGYQVQYSLMDLLEEEWSSRPKVVKPVYQLPMEELGYWGDLKRPWTSYREPWEELDTDFRSFDKFVSDVLGPDLDASDLEDEDLIALERIHERLTGGYYEPRKTQLTLGWDFVQDDAHWDRWDWRDNGYDLIEDGP